MTDGHDVRNALTALRLQTEIIAESAGRDMIAPILRLIDRVEGAVGELLRDHEREPMPGDEARGTRNG